MEIDLTGAKDGVSERFVPDKDTGRLIEAEHLARYRWAAQLAAGRSVLDAGCGTGYGAVLLADAGARAVVGVDIAESVLRAVEPGMPEGVRLQAGDVRGLEYEDDSFELIVCFEVIEHLEDPSAALDELVRVLSPHGVLLISSPNRAIFPAGNPHHHREFEPQELLEALRARLSNVRLVRQHDYLLSAVLSDESLAPGTLDRIRVDKLVRDAPGEELYSLAVASDADMPDVGQLAVLTGTLEFREWLAVFDEQTKAIRDKDNYIGELEARVEERDRLSGLLVDAEQRLAELPGLRLQIADLEHDLSGVRAAEEAVREQLKELDQRLIRSHQVLLDVMNSPSWRVTKPLRAAKKLLRN